MHRFSRSKKISLVALFLALALLVVACGSGGEQTASNTGQSSQNSDSSSAGSSSETPEEELKLDLKTAAEVMDYVKDMDPDQRHDVLLQGAEKEGGTVSLYTTMNENDLQLFHEAFNKSYPDLTLDVWRGDGNDQVYTRAVNEFRAGTYKVDVIDNKFYFSYEFNKEGMLTPYFAPNQKDYPEGLYDPKGMWMGEYVIPVCLAWNTDRIKDADTPKTWQDLTDPKYKGSFSMDTQDDLILYYWRKVFGDSQGTELAQKIAANEPILIRSRSQQMAHLSAGEFDMAAAMYEHNAIRYIDEGAPAKFKYLEGPVLTDIEGTMLDKKAPHPYAAVLYMDWTASPAAQQVIADVGRNAALPGMKYKNPLQGQVLSDRKLFSFDVDEYGPLREQSSSDFKKIFGLTQ